MIADSNNGNEFIAGQYTCSSGTCVYGGGGGTSGGGTSGGGEAPIPAWDTVVARLPIAFVMPNVSNTMTVAQTMLKSV